ncbi:MAG TPA: YciI family protein [Candidatus Sulfopaludibacter sp.]|jgi:uncharacterized protein YciI|nr:YciI family protein [Candidatus Sulfopaludibacter sp.]
MKKVVALVVLLWAVHAQTPAKTRFLAVYSVAHPPDQLTAAEKAILQQHAAYLKSLADRHIVTWAGHTNDPTEPHGYAEVEASETDARRYIANDPAVKAGIFHASVESFDEVVH